MVFLTKIRNYIKKYRSRGFRTSIQQEKKQKYLFSQNNHEISRGKWGLFQKKTNRLSPFSRFIQGKIDTFADVTLREQKYMGYIGVFLILTTLYIVIYSSYFDITPSKVLIESTNEGTDVSIAYRTVEDLYGKNVFMINEDSVALSLQKYQKNISHISIDRLYPNGLKILLTSYPIVFNLKIPQIGNKEWGLSENGVLIPKTQYKSTPTRTLEYITENLNEDSFLDYKVLLENEKTKIIMKVLSFFGDNWSDLHIGTLYYLEKENEIHISVGADTRILLTLQDFSQDLKERLLYNHLKSEMATLKVYIEKNKAEVMSGSISYIDARIPGKIFICKDKIQCQKNLITVYGETYK